MRLRTTLGPFAFFLALFGPAACGGGGGVSTPPGTPPPPATFNRTLAYVVSECRENAQEITAHQALWIQHAEAAPMTLEEFDLGPFPAVGGCPLFGLYRDGAVTVVAYPFQRLGISPDGSTVVFEITDDFSVLHQPQFGGVGSLLPEEKKGFFSVHADGSSLRRLGPASREATFRVVPDSTAPGGFGGWLPAAYSLFSPDGRLITFTDLGPGPTGEDAIQIFVMDIVSGTRTQLTSLPPLAPIAPYDPPVFPGFFLDNDTIQFNTFAATEISVYTVKVSKPGELTARAPVPIPGSFFVPSFAITGLAANVFSVLFSDRTPVNQIAHLPSVTELFVASGTNLLQLTSFNHSDTGFFGSVLSPDRQRVLFVASADPFGMNPYENCQIFSIDTLGADLRQLTAFSEGAHSVGGCVAPYPPGCLTYLAGADTATNSVLLYSSCNPLQTNPYGQQFFAMHFDGTGLSQLSAFKGMVTEADGTVTVELPGPIAIVPTQ